MSESGRFSGGWILNALVAEKIDIPSEGPWIQDPKTNSARFKELPDSYCILAGVSLTWGDYPI